MNSFNLAIIASLSGLLIVSSPYIATSQQPLNQVNRLIVNNTVTPAPIKQIAQAVTVKISSQNKGGSGVLIHKQGTTYTVITNAHVISNKAPYRIQTPDNKIHQATLINKGNSFTGNDLAVLQFKAKENYQTLPLTNTEIAENQIVFAAGFPDDNKQLIISSGKISLLSTQPLAGGYQIGYTNEIQQGMSGGALINESGHLIGINGLASNAILNEAYNYQDGTKPSAEQIQQLRRLSFAVPIRTLAKVAPNLAIIPREWRNQQQAQSPALGNTFVDKVDNIAQQITVKIDSTNHGNGSGVIIAKQGNTYYVATARHVVQNTDNYEIIAPDGKRYVVQSQDIFKPEGIDAALIKFTSNQTYLVASITRQNKSVVSDDDKRTWVFVSGFPEVDRGRRKLTPGLLEDKEELYSLADNTGYVESLLNQGYGMRYTNLSLPGMSGGPVLNIIGEVIGINTASERIDIGDKNFRTINLASSIGIPSSSIISLTTKAGLNEKELKLVSPGNTNQIPKIGDSEINLLLNHPLFAIRKPEANASTNDLLQYANQLWRIGKSSEASAVLQRIIKSNKNFHIAYLMLGAMLFQEEKYEESLFALNQAIAIKPNDYNTWKLQSIVLLQLKKYPLALDTINKMIEENDEDISLYLMKAGTFVQLQRYQEALATTDKALQIQPLSVIYLYRGSIRYTSSDYQGLVNDMNQAIQLEPDLALAYAYRAAGKTLLIDLKGMEDITKAGQLDPNDPRTKEVLLSFLKETSDILADMNKAIELDPDHPVIKEISIVTTFLSGMSELFKDYLNDSGAN
ncbi:MAG: trypsin-like peptidase domain-containing protein [Nostoc sp. CreGUA01]|nr:tetratricopeptide repeat-containing serine protease family protein [Nostoc sp. CreGUA01]